MKFYNGTDKQFQIYFLMPQHVALLKSKGIPYSCISKLLFYPGISESDLIEIIRYQRAMEKELFGEKYTTYTTDSDITHQKVHYDLELLNPKLKTLYEENKSYGINNVNYWVFDNDTFVFVNQDKGFDYNRYKYQIGLLCPLKTIYHALLNKIGYQQLYHRNYFGSNNPKGINLAKLIANCLK